MHSYSRLTGTATPSAPGVTNGCPPARKWGSGGEGEPQESKGCTPKVLGVKLENVSPISGNGQVTAVDCGDAWQNMVCVCVCVCVCERMLAQVSTTWAGVQALWSRLRYTHHTSDVSLRPLDLAGSARCPGSNGINPAVRSDSLFSSAQVRPCSISIGIYSVQN